MVKSIHDITSQHPQSVGFVFNEMGIDRPVTDEEVAKALIQHGDTFFEKLFAKLSPDGSRADYEKARDNIVRSALVFMGYEVPEQEIESNYDGLGRDTIKVLSVLALLIFLAYLLTRE